MVERVGEGDPRARVPDPGARTRLAYEVTVGALHGMYGRLRWGGEDGPASHLAVSGRSNRAGLGSPALRRALRQTHPAAGSLGYGLPCMESAHGDPHRSGAAPGAPPSTCGAENMIHDAIIW